MTEDDGPPAYAFLTFNSPLSEARAAAIVRRLAVHDPADVLDIGCGWGELLLRVLAASPASRGTGIDTDQRLLDRARAAARRRGLADRTTFEAVDGSTVRGPAELVICVGSSHVYGDGRAALTALFPLVRPGGRLLYGDATWDPAVTPDPDKVWPDMLTLPDLGGLVDLAVGAGFRPCHVEAANLDEWDAFESGYLADFEEWLVTHPHHADAAKVRAETDEHRDRWLHGYRGGLGFAYLTLGRPVD